MKLKMKHELTSAFSQNFIISRQKAMLKSTNCHILNNQLFLKVTHKALNARANGHFQKCQTVTL